MFTMERDKGDKYDKTPGRVFCTIDDKYGRFVVENGKYRGEDARLYIVDDVRESASFFDDRKYDLVFDYAKSFARFLDGWGKPAKMLMLGGAGFQFPKYVISHYPDISLDVVEINPLAVMLARKYFFLDDLEEDFKAESSGRLRIIIDDGMEYLRTTRQKYDIIINDAYHSDIPDKGLTSARGTNLIKEHLAAGGAYGFNLITSLEGKHSMPFLLMQKSFGYHFAHVDIVRCSPDVKPESLQNVLFIMKDGREGL